MLPFEVLFSGYAIIGLILVIIGANMALYLLRLPTKSDATRAFSAFSVLIALSGLATILTNSLVYWRELFAPWQDTWIVLSGVALTIFAYSLPRFERSHAASMALAVVTVPALLALFYTLLINYRFLTQWNPALEVNDTFYLLLPLSIMLVLLIFLSRSLQLSARAASGATAGNSRSMVRRLIHPVGEEAQTLRNLALALSLAFLPALQLLTGMAGPYGYVISNIGALLAVLAVSLVYLNFAPEIESFMARLVGITLAAVLLIIGVFSTIDVYVFYPILTEAQTSTLVFDWLLLILVASAVVRFIFPSFYRRALVRPLHDLLFVIKQVNQGDFESVAPIRSQDEIGVVANAFNELTRSLRRSQQEQEALFDRLQASHAELERRVSDRTRELSTFTDLTMLPGSYDDMSHLLQPALNRIMEIGLCQALCVHLLAADGDSMTLVAQRSLPPDAAAAMENVPLLPPFTARIRQIDNPLLANPLPANTFLPRQLHVAPYESYVGSPLAAGQDVHGWLSCYRRESEAFDVNEISLLVALARTLGVIVENHYLHQRVQAVAVYEERQRLARDLHDSVTQLVYSMTLFTRSAQEALEDEEWDRLAHNLAYMADTAREALREMRFLLFELQPPALEEEGLAKALQARLEMVERRIGISVDCQVDESLVSSAELARELYLVATEALNNMLKHADADRVSLVIARDNGSVRLSVLDDGRGFHPAQVSSGMGIKNMRQRIEALGGLLEIHSTPGAGTRIVATVPAVE